MKAETAYNVIQSLPTDEMQRLYRMLEVVPKTSLPPPVRRRRKKAKLIINEMEIREYLIKCITRQQIKNKKREQKKLEENEK